MHLVSATRGLLLRTTDLLWPRACLGCPNPLDCDDRDLCPDCWNRMMSSVGGPYCRTCGEARGPHLLIEEQCGPCRRKQPGRARFHRFIRVGAYHSALRDLILRFKRDPQIERILGNLLRDAIGAKIDPQEVDYWVPIPSHWRRRLARGFQPTQLLADRTLGAWGQRTTPLLAMHRHVPEFHRQGGMSAAKRAAAIRGAFRLARCWPLEGSTVCLIDDITTTGATLAEAKRTIAAEKPRRVLAAVLAKTSRLETITAPGFPPSTRVHAELSHDSNPAQPDIAGQRSRVDPKPTPT